MWVVTRLPASRPDSMTAAIVSGETRSFAPRFVSTRILRKSAGRARLRATDSRASSGVPLETTSPAIQIRARSREASCSSRSAAASGPSPPSETTLVIP